MTNEHVEIYCDGACSGNGRKTNAGGWGAVLKFGARTRTISGGEHNTSNQRMELLACIKALEEVKTSDVNVDVYSDSAYLVNCFKQKWHEKWTRNGWMNSKKEPVENRDLWERLLGLVGRLNVSFYKVNGHSGNEMNDLADELARKAAER